MTATSNWLETLKNTLSELEVEHSKFYEKGNNSAGTRARKLLQDIKLTAQEGRNDIQTAKVTAKK